MLEQGKISNRQAMLLLVSGVVATGLLTFPSLTAAEARQDAWLSVVLAAVVGLAVVWITVSLGWRFPGKTIVEYSEELLGKWLGKGVGLVFICFFLYLAALSVREFSEFIMSVFMEETPAITFTVSILFVAALAIYGGLEVIGRVNEMMLSLTVCSFLFFMFLAVGQMDPLKLTPVLAGGIIPVLKGAIPAAGWLGEVVTIAFLMPYINRPGLARRSGIMAVLILLGIQMTAVVVSIMVFGAVQTGRMQFPAFMVARNVSVMGIFERAEAFFMLLWVAGVFAKITIYYYVTVLATGQLLKLDGFRPLILPIGTIIGALAFLNYGNNSEVVRFIHNVWGPFAIPIELGFPTILLIVAVIRRKGRQSG